MLYRSGEKPDTSGRMTRYADSHVGYPVYNPVLRTRSVGRHVENRVPVGPSVVADVRESVLREVLKLLQRLMLLRR